jgi:S-adenosylmethionine synthetase
VAKNIEAAGLAQKCEVQVSYAIGVARPINLLVETFGTGRIPDEALLRLVQRHFDLRPAAILAQFQLRELPRQRGGRFYQNVAVYGHFGQTHLDLPWERTDKAALLREEAFAGATAILG